MNDKLVNKIFFSYLVTCNSQTSNNQTRNTKNTGSRYTHTHNLNFADDVRDPTLELVFAYPAVHTTTYKQRPFFSMCGLG